MLDTNILISACWTPGGLEAEIAAMIKRGALEPCVSPEMWAEYRSVLNRQKFADIREESLRLLAAIAERACLIEPRERVRAAFDEDDNRFLECAAAAGVEYLITGNLKHYPPEWGSTKIVNARGFFESYSEGPQP